MPILEYLDARVAKPKIIRVRMLYAYIIPVTSCPAGLAQPDGMEEGNVSVCRERRASKQHSWSVSRREPEALGVISCFRTRSGLWLVLTPHIGIPQLLVHLKDGIYPCSHCIDSDGMSTHAERLSSWIVRIESWHL